MTHRSARIVVSTPPIAGVGRHHRQPLARWPVRVTVSGAKHIGGLLLRSLKHRSTSEGVTPMRAPRGRRVAVRLLAASGLVAGLVGVAGTATEASAASPVHYTVGHTTLHRVGTTNVRQLAARQAHASAKATHTTRTVPLRRLATTGGTHVAAPRAHPVHFGPNVTGEVGWNGITGAEQAQVNGG